MRNCPQMTLSQLRSPASLALLHPARTPPSAAASAPANYLPFAAKAGCLAASQSRIDWTF
jgi:hypothetical protein